MHKSNTIAALFDDAFDPGPEDLIQPTQFERISLVPSSDYLKEHNLPNPHKTGELQYALKELIQETANDFDYIILDTPPDIGNLPAWSCLLASHFVLTPIIPETFSAQSISGVDHRLALAQEQNDKLRFLGYLVNMRKKRSSFHDANEERLRAIHGDRVLDTVLTNLMAFSEAQGFRKPITAYSPKSVAAKLTQQLTLEITTRIRKNNT